ncbi:dinitrogenase iron-molybdenum cofactor [Methanobrevibacter cuticularis]|uniref:Dinitrogenase iron-molybdenum cofactor n=1 Tax=Methanobrevibacter cuticularis TaxID=47311 RepID=A0A166CPB5_9EURY|nr:NifB/NifX family molybdenum-iron cluster-binding protein [Methanobrevibacter cuticularis]KZX14723.1 dinitrogenase iron-molybdenum cofactor [Methanobrevibacter cuticularis]
MKIAVASSDGKNVDLHFGKASSLYLYNFDGEKITFDEIRTVDISSNEKHQWRSVLEAIADCDVVICVQAGFKSKFGIQEAGLKLVEDEGHLDEVLNRYINHYKFMNSKI